MKISPRKTHQMALSVAISNLRLINKTRKRVSEVKISQRGMILELLIIIKIMKDINHLLKTHMETMEEDMAEIKAMAATIKDRMLLMKISALQTNYLIIRDANLVLEEEESLFLQQKMDRDIKEMEEEVKAEAFIQADQ